MGRRGGGHIDKKRDRERWENRKLGEKRENNGGRRDPERREAGKEKRG